MQSHESQSGTHEWLETLRLDDTTVKKAIDEAAHAEQEDADVICALITPDHVSPLLAAAIETAAEEGPRRLAELTLAVFRSGVLFGVNMTRIAIEAAPQE